MKNPEIGVEDAELLALMEELEATSTAFIAEVKSEPVAVEEPEPTPEPEPVVEVKPVAPKKPPIEATPMAEELDMSEVASEPSPDTPAASRAKPKFYVDMAEFVKETKVTEATLDACMMEQSSLRAYYGQIAAESEGQAARMKIRCDRIEAQLYNEYKKAFLAAGDKATEKAIEASVRQDAVWQQAKEAQIAAETIAQTNKNLIFCMNDRKDIIMQLAYDRRDGLKGAARVLEAQQERNDFASRAANAAKDAMKH